MQEDQISILYVDDEPAILQLSKDFLEKDGKIAVTTAENADKAIAMFQKSAYDAIVSDYMMPGMNGIEFLEYVRNNFGDVPFIIVTGRGFEEVVITALNLGADYYIQKAGDPRTYFLTLTRNIQLVVEHRRSLRALKKSEELYRNVVEDQTELICRFLPDGTIVFVNDAFCRYYNMKREDLIGKKFRRNLSDDDFSRSKEILSSLTIENPVIEIDYQVTLNDGAIRWQRWRDRAIFDDEGRVIEFQSVGRDITAQRKAEIDLIAFITEATSRLKNPVDIVRKNMQDLVGQMEKKEISDIDSVMILKVQIRNAEQILDNLDTLNREIVEKHDEIPKVFREYIYGSGR